jgi:hypothetical protein
MMGFKKFHLAEAMLSGIELHRMLKKGQHIHSNFKNQLVDSNENKINVRSG